MGFFDEINDIVGEIKDVAKELVSSGEEVISTMGLSQKEADSPDVSDEHPKLDEPNQT